MAREEAFNNHFFPSSKIHLGNPYVNQFQKEEASLNRLTQVMNADRTWVSTISCSDKTAQVRADKENL